MLARSNALIGDHSAFPAVPSGTLGFPGEIKIPPSSNASLCEHDLLAPRELPRYAGSKTQSTQTELPKTTSFEGLEDNTDCHCKHQYHWAQETMRVALIRVR